MRLLWQQPKLNPILVFVALAVDNVASGKVFSGYSFIHVALMVQNILKTGKLLLLKGSFIVDARASYVHS